jgi:hypothetical protein
MDDGSQHVFYINNGTLVHYYFVQGRSWVGENLSTGWNPDTALKAAQAPNGTYQVWGVLANGRRAQTYWSGKAWVTQPLS